MFFLLPEAWRKEVNAPKKQALKDRKKLLLRKTARKLLRIAAKEKKENMAVADALPVGTLLRIVDEGLGAGSYGKQFSCIGVLQNGSYKLQGEGARRLTAAPHTSARWCRA